MARKRTAKKEEPREFDTEDTYIHHVLGDGTVVYVSNSTNEVVGRQQVPVREAAELLVASGANPEVPAGGDEPAPEVRLPPSVEVMEEIVRDIRESEDSVTFE
jgi:hypothetical protein